MTLVKDITPISENSETESVSSLPNTADDLSLDDLFSNLQKEILNNAGGDKEAAGTDSEFEKIKNSIKCIPKLKSSLDSKTFEVPKKASRVIHDPITVIPTKGNSKREEDQDSGKDWFNMPKPEITKEIKNDLLLLSKRDVLDPKRHYKKQKWVQPKFFQIGEIVNDNYSKNMTRKQKGTSLINELLVDDDTKKYFKRRYNEIQDSKTSGKMKDYKKQQKMRSKF